MLFVPFESPQSNYLDREFLSICALHETYKKCIAVLLLFFHNNTINYCFRTQTPYITCVQ